jgi:putative aldouronate transport system permease protein
MFLPIIVLTFVFSYLPLWGWRYAFFDYKSGETLSMDKFVGFKWFTQLFQNSATKSDIIRVLKNTLAMSALGIATSWVPMVFAIFLSEIKSTGFRRFVQTFTTIPNFISWVLVYAIALAIFSTDGFINTFLNSIGISASTNYLLSTSHMWLKMLAWGLWKGLGWSAIIYIAAITGIDQQLYEAATVDGAGRFAKMWYITIPELIPTYMVLLLMSVANILSNGMDQYLVFSNAVNKNTIEVLDLYVYNLGIGSGLIPMSTVIGMVKSVVSVILLFSANGISKLVRGESIV